MAKKKKVASRNVKKSATAKTKKTPKKKAPTKTTKQVKKTAAKKKAVTKKSASSKKKPRKQAKSSSGPEKHTVDVKGEGPSSPREAYQRIIDELVDRTPGVIARRIVQDRHYSPSSDPDFREFNLLVKSLTAKQRKVLARLCDDQRRGATHDVLACLFWWIDAGGLSLLYKGKPMPVDLSGMGLHGDYIGRSGDDAWDWPDESPAPKTTKKVKRQPAKKKTATKKEQNKRSSASLVKPGQMLTEKEMKKFYGKFYKASPKFELYIDPEIGDDEVPETVWPLAPYAEFWGISDDYERGELVDNAPGEVLENLKAVVAAFDDDLDDWLAGPAAEDPHPSDAYIAYTCMRMAADEA